MTLPIIPPQVRLALKLAPWLIAAALLAALFVTRATLAARKTECVARYDRLVGDVRTATARAAADDLANARRVEADQSRITQEVSRDLEAQLVDARTRAADYARRLRAAPATDTRGGGAANVSGTPISAGTAAGAGGTPELDADLRICAEAVVKAQGWQDWWRAVEAVPR